MPADPNTLEARTHSILHEWYTEAEMFPDQAGECEATNFYDWCSDPKYERAAQEAAKRRSGSTEDGPAQIASTLKEIHRNEYEAVLGLDT